MDQTTAMIMGASIAVVIVLKGVISAKTGRKRNYEPRKEREIIRYKETFVEDINEYKEFEFPYRKNKWLLSKAELSFTKVLEDALDNTIKIIPKVRMADVIQPEYKLNNSEKQSAFNRISRKHFDFILVNAETYEIINAIELDDSSHERMDRVERDDFVDKTCERAGLKLIRIKASRTYSVKEIKELVLGHKEESLDQSNNADNEQQEIIISSQVNEEDKKEVPICSKCGLAMVKKKSTKPGYSNEEFWACPGYPQCRNVIPVQ